MESLAAREALARSNRYRTWKWSYGELCERSRAFAAELVRRGVAPGDRVLLWAENRPEWAAAFWGTVLVGAAAVPVDFRSSPDLARRVFDETDPALAVVGDEVDADALPRDRRLRAAEVDELADAGEAFRRAPADPAAVVEILYTSGSTSRPKGVVQRHRNIAANLSGVAREIKKFRGVARPFQPIRILDMLPLSHLFGQTMGLFIPPLLGGAAAFTSEMSATALVETIRRERISVFVGVPAMLESLRTAVEPNLARPAQRPGKGPLRAVVETWWRQRDLHARLGWKFWAFVTGGARLDEDLEGFWRNCGYAVVQGYGLTEAAPVVALNHPFSSRRGSLGKPLPGQEVRIAPDGEILVRGANVAEGYYGEVEDPGAGSTRFEGGWLHTGDLGEFDEQGRLYYRGRKRDLIVRPDGMNVHPQDVEAALLKQPGVAEAVVLGIENSGAMETHAALVLEAEAGSETDSGAVVAQANRDLEPHQRIQSHTVWQADDLPRTASTLKVRKNELAGMVVAKLAGRTPDRERSAVERILGRDLADGQPLRLEEDLGLSSLDRVELLAKVEQATGRPVAEESFSAVATTAELESLLRGDVPAAPKIDPAREALLKPRWSRNALLRPARAFLLEGFVLPLVGRLIEVHVEGLAALDELDGPAVFVANHASHFDTAVLYQALPTRIRRRIAPAMSQDYFRDYFHPENASPARRRQARLSYFIALGLFNAYPLPQQMSGTRRALEYSGELVADGYSLLVYPEGTRTLDGEVGRFLPGAALLAQRLEIPIVPVGIEGLFEIYSSVQRVPKKGRVAVRFGAPIEVQPSEDLSQAAARAETKVRALASRGATIRNGNPSTRFGAIDERSGSI